ncbi:UbiA family prenyltransferase, partial [Rhizobium hidalgonense]
MQPRTQSITLSQRFNAYVQLTRFDKPIGTELLLWPTFWAVWLAANGQPSFKVVLIMFLGVLLMRAAGCAINDFADRKVDGLVERTK